MKRINVVGVLLLLALLFATDARGDTFSVRQCDGDPSQSLSGSYTLLGSDYVDVVRGCNGTGGPKLGVYQDRSNRRIPFGSGGQFIWYTSGGNEIVETSISGKLNSRNGMVARLIGANSASTDIALDTGSDHTGDPSLSRWNDPNHPITVVVARLHCQPSTGCENNSNSQKAFLELTNLEFAVRDSRQPTVSASGELKDWGDTPVWHRGSATYSMSSSDQGSGLSRSFLKVNGSRLDEINAACPGARTGYATNFNPCPSSLGYQDLVDSSVSPFQEGLNRIQFCAEDYSITASSGVPTCTAERWVLVDNRPPEVPNSLEVEGGSDWRSSNSFDLKWLNPTDQSSPIAAAEYSIYDDLDNLVSGPTRVAGIGIAAIQSVQVPSPGTYRASVTLVDAAGNVGQPASATLRFDDGRPGNVAPEDAPGWVSADELPLRQLIERATPGGPSGVDGYAVSVSRVGPEVPCPSGTCEEKDLTVAGGQDERTVTIPDLSEGDHWISSVAASGAGLASEEPKSTQIHVDKTDPVTTLEGVPTDWVNRPVTVVATATDDASGMTPASGGDPVTVIEPADQSPYISPGPVARFTIANEGRTTVRYWARDLAGNANDGSLAPDGDRHLPPGSATVRIDTVAPSLNFDSGQDPADPELVTAAVRDRDSGVRDGRIYFRRAGSSEPFTSVETRLSEGVMSARLPSDEMERGSYELKVEATDWAGNSSSSQSDSSGAPMVINAPLKREVLLSGGLLKKRKVVRSLRLRPGSSPRVTGHLAMKTGGPIGNALLTVTETFAAGSRQAHRVSVTRTDGKGSFLATLGSGPIRSVQVSYGGSSTLSRASTSQLRVETYDRTSLRIAPNVIRNGGTVKMVGSVRGEGGLAPARGKLIAIQYFDPSRAKWRPAEVLRTNRKGRYSYRYRFRTITTAQRIIFRATSLPEAGWPFLASTSKPRSVIVYPRTGR